MIGRRIEGFCTRCHQDQPSTSARRCTVCGHPLIPPSWSRRTTPWPWTARPEGWHWEKPTDDAPAKKAATKPKQAPVGTPIEPEMIDLVCARCNKAVTVERRGGSEQRYCSPTCRYKMAPALATTRRQATTGCCVDCGRDARLLFDGRCKACRDRVRRAKRRPDFSPRACRDCGETYQPVASPLGGRASVYCSDECKRAVRRRRSAIRDAKRARRAA